MSDIDGTHIRLIITGWMDCIDDGFAGRAGGVCEDAIRQGCKSQHAERGEYYTLGACSVHGVP